MSFFAKWTETGMV